MEHVGAVQKRKSLRLRASFVMCAAAVLMLVAIRGSFAAKPADKITICHRTNSATQPYHEVTDDISGTNSGGPNDHTSHTGPVASSEEIAQQLKDQHIDWGDIVPPFGEFPGLNWDAAGQAIWNNGCNLVVASDDGSDAPADDSTDAPADDSTDAPADDSTDAPADDSTDAPADDSADAPADDSADAPADDSTDAPADDSTDAVDDGAPSDDGSDVISDDSNADDDGSAAADDSGEVLGRTVTRPLAQTGSETTILAVIGFAMLLAGSAMRFGRFGREVYATASQTPADKLAKMLQARSRHWTCRK